MTSGRAAGDYPGDTRRRSAMIDWITKHDLPLDILLMRSGGDQRRDSLVKREMYEQYIEPFYKVLYVFDDRDQVVATWRELGLTVLQVKDPVIVPPICLQEGL